MASFIVHEAALNILIKSLKLTEEAKTLAYVGNLIPDIVSGEEVFSEDLSARKEIQNLKITTHFRDDLDAIFQYPNMNLFLNKYQDKIKDDPYALGIFFHLYIDNRFYHDYLPSIITSYDENMNVTKSRKQVKYFKINKTGKMIDETIFFNPSNEDGIYKEYNRLNKYVINKYPIIDHIDERLNYIKTHNINTVVSEMVVSGSFIALDILKNILVNSDDEVLSPLTIFDEQNMYNFIESSVNDFINEYQAIIKYYQ